MAGKKPHMRSGEYNNPYISVRLYIGSLSARWPVRSDTEQATCDARYETDARAASFTPPEPPGHAADDPRHTQPTLPHKAVRGACAPRSSTCTLLVVVESAGP
eukprot:7391475-Prymnesium_polylepis.2